MRIMLLFFYVFSFLSVSIFLYGWANVLKSHLPMCRLYQFQTALVRQSLVKKKHNQKCELIMIIIISIISMMIFGIYN